MGLSVFGCRFYRNWNVDPSDLEFGRKLAQGSEGEVFQGRLRGYPDDVVIKRSINFIENAHQAWEESEVRFMMLMVTDVPYRNQSC